MMASCALANGIIVFNFAFIAIYLFFIMLIFFLFLFFFNNPELNSRDEYIFAINVNSNQSIYFLTV